MSCLEASGMQACNLVYPYFENPEMLKRLVENWNSYSEGVYEAIRIILVDDNSTKEARPIFEQCRAPKALLRFMEPALWTMHEARNLGALGGASSWPGRWLLMSDIDHIIIPEMLVRLLTKPLDKTFHYTLERVIAPDNRPSDYHCNSYLVSDLAYWSVNGYDVDFCGAHGGGYGGDGEFARQLSRVAPRVHLRDVFLIRYGPDVVADARTTKWDRSEWAQKCREVLSRKRMDGTLASLNPVRRKWERLI
jgi:hypothetical protein